MAIGVCPITVGEAGPIMAKSLGLRWSEDRTEVVEYLNRYRQLLYSLYKDLRLFDDVFHCICLEDFRENCSTNDYYRGFTLPSDVLGVEAVYKYGFPLTLHSRWRESHTGIGVDVNTTRVGAVLMAEQFCTERDLNETCRLRVYAEHPEDQGKCVVIEGLADNHRATKARVELSGDGVVVTRQKFAKILSVSLPPERKGSVTLMDNNRRVLSIYTPYESVPLYRRMKVPPSCNDSVVLVQGNKRYQKIFFDHDIVEVGNQLVIESAGRFFKFGETSTDPKELNRAAIDRAFMGDLLRGDMERQQGAAKQDGYPYAKINRLVHKSLPGYSRPR